jgi:uncharacterized repeat protein (TIGR03803 family)
VTTSGTLTTLNCFGGADGYDPFAGLVLGTDGNLHGTTFGGGRSGQGSLFNITTAGDLTTLFDFNGVDGEYPESWLIQATDGNFYGTTLGGGAEPERNACSAGCGTVFKVTPQGALTTLHSFDGTDGHFPRAGLFQAINGNFYGSTDGSLPTLFEITPDGNLTTLYTFDVQAVFPNGLLQTVGGDIYGTTRKGGANGCGMIYKIGPSGKVTRVYSFSVADGCSPSGGLIQATDGNFYGVTGAGGSPGGGTIFRLSPEGTLTVLYNLPDCVGGCSPSGTLVQATDGNLYGTTALGPLAIGNCPGGFGDGCGTVFKLNVGLGPFVKTVPTSGSVGTAVIILGTNLTGATEVKFNGVAAPFNVASSSEITATVPAGATTGEVDVETPGGKLSSNIQFTVAP